MITSTIKFSQIEDRVDAEYYKPEYLETYQILGNKKIVKLEDIAKKLVNGGTPDIEEGKFYKTGITFLKNGNIKEMEIDYNDIEFISEYSHSIRKRSALKKNDVLVTIAGTIGNAAVFDKEIEGNINQNICRIVVKNVNPYYLAIFLNSKLGKNQLIRHATVQTIQYINNQILGDVRILIPPQSFQRKIENMVKEAQKKQRLTDEKYKEAEQILGKELGLEGLDLSTQKTFEAKFSEINERIDPQYYRPIFNRIEKVFKKQKIVNLGDISLEIKYGTSEDLFYVGKGTPFLRVTDINKFSNIEPMEGKFISNFDAERLKEYQVKKDDIIISRTGTLGLAVYIDEKLDGAIYGSYFIKVKPRHKDLYNRFIAFFISSKIGRLQTNRWASGGIQTNLTIDAINSIRIPILPKSTQQKISLLIQESFRFRKEAKNLLEEAKQKVEKMI